MVITWDLLIKRLGITAWKLRYPVILINGISITLLVHLRFLMISDRCISLNDLFVQDVIHAVNLKCTESYIITVNQINDLILPKGFLYYSWWIGVNIVCNFHCVTLNTPSLDILKNDIHAKRDLWNQINQFIYK